MILGIAFVVISLGLALAAAACFVEKEKGKGLSFGLGALLLAAVAVFLIFAILVPMNNRVLLIDWFSQQPVGTRTAGIQWRPFFAKKVAYPAERAYRFEVHAGEDTESASSADQAALKVDVTIYFDVSQMDLESAYRDFNGDFGTFSAKYLSPQLARLIRKVSRQFTTDEHTTAREEWVDAYEEEVAALLQVDGYGLKLAISGGTMMSWDFVSDQDREAFERANRAAYLITQRENELKAALVEKEIADIKNLMVLESAKVTVASLQEMASQKGSGVPIFPPDGGGVVLTYDVAPLSTGQVLTETVK